MNDSQKSLQNDQHSISPEAPIQPYLVPSQLLHDLRTPLNLIIGYSELLGEQLQQENRDDLAVDSRRIFGAGKNLQSLLETHFQGVKGNLDAPTSSPAVPEHKPAHFPGDAIADNTDAGEESCLILVVDDNESNRDVLARRLGKQNYLVEMAESGSEALEKLQEQSFDVVLLDVMMPEMDGYEVLQRMKSDAALHHIPVIMISALGEMDSVVRCIEMGAEDYLPKPFSPTILRARIGACIHKKRAHDREARLLTQVQENYAQLRHLEQQRDDLMHMVIHDLRSPLSSNIAGIEMVEILGPLTNEQRECLQIAMRSGQNLLELINDLLDIAKMEEGGIQLELQPHDAADLTAGALEQVLSLLGDRKLQLTQNVEPGLPPLFADKSKLQRVFINLLANAIKFTPRGGDIIVGARRDGDFALFSIQDNGEGIPADEIEGIFQKYRQVENRLSGRQNSTGLGLTYCRLAVETHGGRIWAESTPGKGSTFYFTIPLAPQAITPVS